MDIRFSIPSAPILVFLFVAYLATLLYLRVYQGRRLSVFRLAILTTFVIYLLAVLHFVLFPIQVEIGSYASQNPGFINVIPLLTADLRSFLSSVILMVPLGVFLPLLLPTSSSVKTIARQTFKLSLAIELTQFVTNVILGNWRVPDVNDLLANTLGGVLGYLLFKQMSRVTLIDHLLHWDARPTR
ncbi:VanZ family protein [Nostoc flagelliforme FACHB-838]|uniref:VanZ family protein n=1 Tax=Nostoc flagelliforme FACHB-838 TaxID=2692904 RepID=A0ABR8E503_9NOSO|nr:VanZ family protein [Nostoc flagelliforme]MBD2536716.1 VanZ family protein [Nostoc flagelliforme FACHB-838]